MRNVGKIFKKYHIATFLLIFVFIALSTVGIILAIRGVVNEVAGPSLEIEYDSSVSEEQKRFVEDLLIEKTLDGRNLAELAGVETQEKITVSARGLEYHYEPRENAALYAVRVPVVDFYEAFSNISTSEAMLASGLVDFEVYPEDARPEVVGKVKFIDVSELSPEMRLVSIDEHYYLDEFDAGAEFTVLEMESGSERAAKYLADLVATKKNLTGTRLETLSFAQTGVTAIARNMTNTLNGAAGGNGAWFAEYIKDFLSAKDIVHISSESSFVDGCKGGTGTMMLCSDWRSLDTITAIGTTIVELTGNHNNNFGGDTNIATIEKYHELGIQTVGGGVNEEAAAEPLLLDQKQAKITFLAYNQSTSSKANGELADGENPGANGYTEEKIVADIAAAKARGDFVLVDVQFSECYCYPDGFVEYPVCDAPITGQSEFFRHIIDLGADMVVGTQAHQPQTFEMYKGKPIYYGLGNLFFDQTYWPDTEKGLILVHYFVGGKYVQTRILPTIYGETHQPALMETERAEIYLGRLINSSERGE